MMLDTKNHLKLHKNNIFYRKNIKQTIKKIMFIILKNSCREQNIINISFHNVLGLKCNKTILLLIAI